MMYRAKCTRIRDLLTKIYKGHHPHFVKDRNDTYLEVDTLQQADCIERLNKAEEERLQAEMALLLVLDF